MHSRTPPGELPAAAESPPSSALLDRLSFAGFVLAVLFLCFICGALVILTDVFPAQAMKDAYRGGKAYVDKMKMSENPLARSEEHTSELQSLMRISYAVFCLKKKNTQPNRHIEKDHNH